MPSVPVAQASKMDWHRWQVGDEGNFLYDCRENRSKETQATAAQPRWETFTIFSDGCQMGL